MRHLTPLVVTALLGCGGPAATEPTPAPEPEPTPAIDPLPSWTDGPRKQAILDFVDAVSTEGSPDFVPEAERIAVFDNDGTLWAEKPTYFQLLFTLDRVKELAGEHPEWATTQPFQAAIEGDMAALGAAGIPGLLQLVGATHGGITTESFEEVAKRWLGDARHPTTGRPYTEMVYQPMIELMDHLRSEGFQVWIMSAGGVDFMRPWATEVYGVPRHQVVGSAMAVTYEVTDAGPVLEVGREPGWINDGPAKPVGIHRHIGRRPIAAFGNSDGDYEMIAWTLAGPGPRLGAFVHHTDGEREWAYDRDSSEGRLVRGLDDAAEGGWLLIDMQADWTRVFPAP